VEISLNHAFFFFLRQAAHRSYRASKNGHQWQKICPNMPFRIS